MQFMAMAHRDGKQRGLLERMRLRAVS